MSGRWESVEEEAVWAAGHRLLSELHDIDFHHYAEYGFASIDNEWGEALVERVADLCDQVDAAAKDARRAVTHWRRLRALDRLHPLHHGG